MSNDHIEQSMNRLRTAVESHRHEAVTTCNDTCWCWEADTLLALLEAEPELKANYYSPLRCVQCGKTGNDFVQTSWPAFTCRLCYDKLKAKSDAMRKRNHE